MNPFRCLLLLVSVLPLAGCAATAFRPTLPATQVRFPILEASPAQQGERYFVMVFGAQTTPRIPRFTHSWATVVKVADRGPGACPIVEHASVSWMPATGQIRPWHLRVEPGMNLDVYASLALTLDKGERISVWGPFETNAAIYQKFLMQKSFLDSGRMGYQCIDALGESRRRNNGRNCIHALTDVDSLFDPRDYPIFRFGDAASETVVRQLAEGGALVNPCRTHDWLIQILGLDRYPLVRHAL